MPNLDQTGPNGQGAGTGRRLGRCFQDTNSENLRGQGLGLGRGRGMGRGRGAGRGQGRDFGRNQ